jgi:hypothetical protein
LESGRRDLTNVTPEVATVLAYTMLAVVAIFLTSGPAIVYYYWKKNKRAKGY